MADGNEYNVLLLKEAGKPIEVVYAAEGSPSIVQPSAVFAAAPHPNAARLFQNYLFSVEGQELFVNLGGLRSVHALVKDKPGRTPLSAIKVWKDDPAAVETQGEEIKRRYSQIFSRVTSVTLQQCPRVWVPGLALTRSPEMTGAATAPQ